MNKEDLHQDADAAIQDRKTRATILTDADKDTEDGLEIQKGILKLHARAGAQADAAALTTMIMTATGDTATAAMKEEAGMAILKDIQKLLKEAGRTAAEDRAEAILIMTIMTATGITAAAVVKEEAGTAILKDIQKPLKEAGKTVAEDHAEAILIMMITAQIMILTAATVARADGSEILKDIPKPLKEAGSIAEEDLTGEAQAAEAMAIMTEEAIAEDHHAADLHPWTAMRYGALHTGAARIHTEAAEGHIAQIINKKYNPEI
jgi:hypothetical protein